MFESKTSWICFLVLLIINSSIQQTCRNEYNEPVDWFVIYKLPVLRSHKNPLVEKGFGYAYISSDNNRGWTLSEKSIADRSSIPGLTLAPMYEVWRKKSQKKSLLFILYNDQPPTKEKIRGGHTKGVIVAGKGGGFWLIHSVPNYPSPPTKSKQYQYPKSGFVNGQSFLCITLKRSHLENAGKQLKYNDPPIYAESIPKHLKNLYPVLTDLASGEQIESPPWNKSSDISTVYGTKFRVFSKSPEFGRDLYAAWVAPNLEVNLLVQTWRNARDPLPSWCSGRFRVENVDEVNIAGVSFYTTKDHSKWAVSTSKNNPWVCVGDINRHASQKRRGGGTVCTKDISLWQAYKESVTERESCENIYSYRNAYYPFKQPLYSLQKAYYPRQQHYYWGPYYWYPVHRTSYPLQQLYYPLKQPSYAFQEIDYPNY